MITPPADQHLWNEADLAAFLRLDDVAKLDTVIATAGVPVLKAPGLGLRAVPSLVRDWAVRSTTTAPIAVERPASVGWVPAGKRKVGSGAAKVQPMTVPIERAAAEFAAAVEGLLEATTAYRKAASLAYREGGRVVGTFGDAVNNGHALDARTVIADLQGVTTLGQRAQAAEIALTNATLRFGAAASDLVAHMGGPR